MTDEERYVIQGRTRDALKQAKLNLSTLGAVLQAYAQRLTDTREVLLHYISDPIGKGPNDILKADFAAHWVRELQIEGFEDKLYEFSKETKRVRELQEQVDKF